MELTEIAHRGVLFTPEPNSVLASELSFVSGSRGTLVSTGEQDGVTYWHVMFPCGDLLLPQSNFTDI
jgi:hypothetical protein